MAVTDRMVMLMMPSFFYSKDAWPESTIMNATTGLPKLSAQEATANCDYLNVAVIQKPAEKRQCLAILSHHHDASFHMQSFRRKENNGTKGHHDSMMPVGKGLGPNGGADCRPIPDQTASEFHRRMLGRFLNNVDRLLPLVRQAADRVARDNAVVAIATNKGYSDLLANFACLCKARGIDLGQVLIFATDPETQALAENLGMTAFYDEQVRQ